MWQFSEGRRQGANGARIRRGSDGMQEAHVGDVVEIYFFFQDDGEGACFVPAHCKDGKEGT